MLFRSRARAGFTLLEILLASLIAGLLLAALYFAMNMTIQQAQTTRDAVAAEDLARGVFAKMTGDLNGTLAPLPPKSGGNAAGSGGAVTGGTAGTDPNAAAAGTAGTAAGTDPNATTTEPATPGATDNSTAVAADLAFQGGLIGEETKFTIFVGRTPEVFGRYGNPGEQVRADLRQIIYWFEPGRGLYRRERPWVTAEGVRNGVEADPDAPDSVLLADEVTAATFEYADGGSFVGTWDGTTPGPDGVTPMGPTRAVKITLTYQVSIGRGKTAERTVSQVIVIRAAPGSYTPPLVEAPTDAATEGGTTTGGTTGGTSGGTTGGTTGGNANSGMTTGGTKTGGSTGGSTGGTTGGTTGGKTGGSTGGGATGGTSGSGGGGKTGGTSGGATSGGKTGGTTSGGGR